MATCGCSLTGCEGKEWFRTRLLVESHHGLAGGFPYGRNREAIGDLPCARELFEEMVAERATVFALNADARIHFNPAKARVALRADGVVSLHAPSLPRQLR